MAFMFAAGCHSYEGQFAHKSEEELDAMEAADEQVGNEFRKGAYGSAEASLQALMSEATVSLPQYELERVSILLMQGRSDDAHAQMMKVRDELETLFDPEMEQKAISVWHGENNKVFKGDSHERATLYALLAMSFMERGKWDDAERCVKNGLLADSANTRDEQYNSDYALLHYLGAVACRKAGRISEAESYLSQMNDAIKGRGVNTESGSSVAELLMSASLPDAFVVAWVGTPPQYVRGGEYGEVRHPVRGAGMHYAFMTVEVDGTAESIAPMRLGDVNWQALTRGGREMDAVLAHKASVKTGMRVSRNIFLVAGFSCVGTVSSNPIVEAVLLGTGGTCLAIGGMFHLAGSAMNPKSDVRSWHCLPGEFVVVPVRINGDEASVVVRGYNSAWDNVSVSGFPMKKKAEGMPVRHLHLLPNGNAIKALSEWYKAATESAAAAEKSSDMSHEIKFVNKEECK